MPGRGGDVAVIQRGLIGALRLEPLDAGIVRPHEGVAPGPVAGRRQLMEATEANLEPIFLLHDPGEPDEPGAARRLVEEAAVARPPLAEAVTADGLGTGSGPSPTRPSWPRSRPAWRPPGRSSPTAITATPPTSSCRAGAGRRATGRALGTTGSPCWSMPGPIRRGSAPFTASSRSWTPRPRPSWPRRPSGCGRCPAARRRLPAAVGELADASSRGTAFVIAGGDRTYLLTEPDPLQVEAAMPGGTSERWRGLATAVLQELLAGRLWGIPDNERTIGFVHNDAAAAVRAADEVPGGTAVICSPLSAADVYAVAAARRAGAPQVNLLRPQAAHRPGDPDVR